MPSRFATLLRGHRIAANLSQERLAETANVSVSAIGTYERGVHSAPHSQTVQLLADALSLAGSERAEFELAAKRKPRAGEISAASSDTAFDNLPIEATSFIGRSAEFDDLSERLSRHRLVTITGIGGLGKTRIALRLAARCKSRFRDGVMFIDFGSILDSALVASKVAASVGIPLRDDTGTYGAANETIATFLRDSSMLFVFDNCEHLLESTGALASVLLRACPKVTILATSRERLRITGEAVYRLNNLPLPPLDVPPMDAVRRHEATLLFVERAKATGAQFTLTEDRARAVVDICRRLDGIPLAIELAASHVVTLGVTTLRTQLDVHLSRLAGGNRDLPTRQRTLQATLAWSYDLLQGHECVLLKRLSAFSGGWTLEAAQVACADAEVPEAIVLDALESLVEKSLLSVDFEPPEARYSMLQVTRSFALAKAEAGGRRAVHQSRHAAWMVDLAARAYDDFLTRPGGHWRSAYDAELDNVRAALAWALDAGDDAVAAAKMMTGFADVWTTNLLVAECRSLTRAVLAKLDHQRHPRLTGRLTFTLSTTSFGLAAIEEGELAISLMAPAEDASTLARCFQLLGLNCLITNQIPRAQDALHRALQLYGVENAVRLVAPVHSLLCAAAIQSSDRAEAERQFALAVKTAEAMEDAFAIQMLQPNLAESEFIMGNAAGALRRLNETFPDFRRVTPRRVEVFLRLNRAGFRVVLGDLDGAHDDASIVLGWTRSNDEGISAFAVQHLATVAALRKESTKAARLLGFIDNIYARSGAATGAERIVYHLLIQSLRGQLPESSIAVLREQGASMRPDQAYDEALSSGDSVR